MSQNLLAQLRELEREKAAINLGEEERRSVQMQTELSALEENLARIDERLQELDESLSKQNKAAEDLRNQLEASREVRGATPFLHCVPLELMVSAL